MCNIPNMLVEKVFIKQHEGVQINSNQPCALYLLREEKIGDFMLSVKNNILFPVFQPAPVKIFSEYTDIWYLVIWFQEGCKNIEYDVVYLNNTQGEQK